jgi:tetratricopeptide (TPR) repeat protein
VYDAESNEPLAQAHIILSVGGIPAGETLTNAEGSFFFRDLAAGGYELAVRAQGFHEGREQVDLTVMSIPTVFIYLTRKEGQRNPVLLEPLRAEEELAPKEARKEYARGLELFRQRKWAESKPHFEKAIALYPQYASAHTALGRVLMMLQQPEAAQESFQAAISINPNYAVPRLFLGGLLNAKHLYSEALEHLQVAVNLQPNNGVAHFEIGRSYWGLRNIEMATRHTLRAHELEPEVAQVHLMCANVYTVKGDLQRAVEEIDQFLKLRPQGLLSDYARHQRARLVSQAGLAPKP